MSGGEFGGERVMDGDDIAVGQQGGGVDEGVADVLQRTPTAKLASGWRTAVWCARSPWMRSRGCCRVVIGGPAPDAATSRS